MQQIFAAGRGERAKALEQLSLLAAELEALHLAAPKQIVRRAVKNVAELVDGVGIELSLLRLIARHRLRLRVELFGKIRL